jgi:hypothetical protein
MSKSQRKGYLHVLRNREFRGLTLAQVTSDVGDQISLVALSVLVFDRTNSAFFAALTYALGHLPLVIGGAFLSSLADRLPRKRLLMMCDAGRGLLMALLALLAGGIVPLWVLFALVLTSAFLSQPFFAARSALLPDLFEDSGEYVIAVSLGRVLFQLDQVLGFLAGGAIIALLSARGALLVDVATFGVSFLLVASYVRARPVSFGDGVVTLRLMVTDMVEGAKVVFGDPARRALVLLVAAMLVFAIAPEGLAVAYAHERMPDATDGQVARAIGFLQASGPLGMSLGAWGLARYIRPRRQADALLPLAVGCMLPLLVTFIAPPIWLAFVVWTLSGVLSGFSVMAIATFNLITDSSVRGRANGLAAATIALTQAAGLAIWGKIADWQGAATAVAWAGTVGVVVMVAFWIAWRGGAVIGTWRAALSATAETDPEPASAG